MVDGGGVVRGGLVVFGADDLRLDADCLGGGGEVLWEDYVVEAEADGAAGGDFVALIDYVRVGREVVLSLGEGRRTRRRHQFTWLFARSTCRYEQIYLSSSLCREGSKGWLHAIPKL